MIKHKTIHNIFEFWGRGKQKVPPNNNLLKREILSKVPVNFERKVSFKRSPLVWLPFAFSAIAVFILVVNITGYSNNVGRQNIVQTESQTGFFSTSDTYKSTISIMPSYRGEGLAISDKREFLKVGYNATLRTRRIADLKNRVEIIVRGLDGRVDASSGTDRSGYVSFAVPQNRLESFKIEIKDLVGTRFYSEQTNSQNLLPAKQQIEESQRQTEKNLSSLQAERGQIIGNHNQKMSSYQNRIISINTEINTLNTEYQYATAQRKAEITNRINQIQTEMSTIQSEIVEENKDYQTKINGVNSQIKNAQENLKIIQTQDNNLLDSVATVNGSISLNWISLWEIVDAYLPGPLLTWIFFAAAFLAFLWYRYSMRISYDSFDFS